METEAQELERLKEKYIRLTKVIKADEAVIEKEEAAVRKMYKTATADNWESEWEFQEAKRAHTDKIYTTSMAMQGSLNQMWKTTSRLAELGYEATEHEEVDLV